jgi:UDP-N-acetylmuramoyl-L-alanyl-D-glutamate--2,6-diaminopimelate ligase
MILAQPRVGPLLSELLAGLAAVPAAHDRMILGLASDSREIQHGECFFAYPGARGHGGAFIEAAIRAGAVAVVVDAGQNGFGDSINGVPVIRVPDLGARMGIIAGRFFGDPSRAMQVIGVTGTNGKTSVTHFLAHALSRVEGLGPCALAGTLGYGLAGQLTPTANTTPGPIALQRMLAQLRDRRVRSLAMEVSSHGLEQGRVSGTAFDIAVFTNLSRDHLDYHGSMAAYGAAKKRLFHWPGLRAAVLNFDDPLGLEIAAEIPSVVRLLGYSLSGKESPHALVRGTDLAVTNHGLRMQVETPWGVGLLKSPLLGRFNAYNLLAALAVLLEAGAPLDQALESLSVLPPVPGRLERFGGLSGQPSVVVDYAHTPDALAQALKSVREVCAGTLWCVFGCGGERDAGKRPLMGQAAEANADTIIVTTDNPRGEDPFAIIQTILSGIREQGRVQVEPDRAKAIAAAIRSAREGDVVLVAGKGHETYQEIAGIRHPFSDRDLVRGILAGGMS